ncbi:phenylacetate--CoA ligase family protein [Rhizomicrobium palustre]
MEARRAAHLKHLYALLPEMIQRMYWPRGELDLHRTQAFRDMLAHAKTHSPWWKDRLAHIDAETATLDDLKRIPVMTKNDLMENWDSILTIPGASRAEAEAALRTHRDQFYIWEDHVLMSSGGTGGRPGIFVYDFDSLARLWASMARGFFASMLPLAQQGISIPDGVKVVSVGGEASNHGSFILGRIFSNPKNPTTLLSGWRSLPDNLDKLNALQPHFVFAYPSLVAELAEAQRHGRINIAPRAFYFGGEQLHPGIAALAQETWPEADILTCWGTTEGGGTFACRFGGYHVCEDLVAIEPVNAAGEPVAPGELSAGIYFSNFYNKALPILRYQIDDVFEFATEPCPCGSVHAKVVQVHGRTADRFVYKDVAILPATLELSVLEQPDILEYQFRQTENGAHLLYRADRPVDEARLLRRMEEALRGYGLEAPEVSVEKIDTLARSAAGKLKHYLPLAR